MIRRFATWSLNLAAIALLVAIVLLIPRASTPRPAPLVISAPGPEVHLTGSGTDEGLTGAPNDDAVPRTRGIEPATSTDPAQQAVVGAPLSQAPVVTGRDQSGSDGERGSPSGPTSVSLDLASFALPTPALRPLASDCRLPCYGTARVGPASWFNAGPGWYAAIPGYVGGVVSVVVCTFPDGRANCHTFPVITSCQCYRHTKAEIVVDLSPKAFLEFAPTLLQGIVMVQVTVLR